MADSGRGAFDIALCTKLSVHIMKFQLANTLFHVLERSLKLPGNAAALRIGF